MTNEEKYKTPEERIAAFGAWCPSDSNCISCVLRHKSESRSDCMAYWLALEAKEEKPMPCPFCGGKVVKESGALKCTAPLCGYSLLLGSDPDDTVAAHNRVCRAVKAAKESEVAE